MKTDPTPAAGNAGDAPNEWMDNYDLMMLLRVSKSTLQRYRSNSKLPYHKMEGTILYKRRDVLTWIEQKKKK